MSSKSDKENLPNIIRETIPITSDSRKLNWNFRLISDEEIAERDCPENLDKLKKERLSTEEADKYRTSHAITFKPHSKSGWAVIPVLHDLWGTPWNNAALSFTRALRPSAIRVTSGVVTCDARTWRVTVYLDKDDRTIRCIEQEVDVDLYGFRNGQDARLYINKNYEVLEQPQPNIIINPRAIQKLRINDDE